MSVCLVSMVLMYGVCLVCSMAGWCVCVFHSAIWHLKNKFLVYCGEFGKTELEPVCVCLCAMREIYYKN